MPYVQYRAKMRRKETRASSEILKITFTTIKNDPLRGPPRLLSSVDLKFFVEVDSTLDV